MVRSAIMPVGISGRAAGAKTCQDTRNDPAEAGPLAPSCSRYCSDAIRPAPGSGGLGRTGAGLESLSASLRARSRAWSGVREPSVTSQAASDGYAKRPRRSEAVTPALWRPIPALGDTLELGLDDLQSQLSGGD